MVKIVKTIDRIKAALYKWTVTLATWKFWKNLFESIQKGIKTIWDCLGYIFLFIAWSMLVLMLLAFIGVAIDNEIFGENLTMLLCYWLDTPNKHETLKFIGLGMSGTVVGIGAIALNRRANAEIKNNRLTEKGRDDARFQSITENLGHSSASVRIAAFYRFYYYASKKGQSDQFKNDVFEILCSYLRTMPKETSECEKKQKEYEMERHTLFNILFKDKFKSKENGLIPDNAPADLQHIHLDGMELAKSNLSNANLFNANLSGAFLMDANLSDAKLIKAILSGAYLIGTDCSKAILFGADLSGANLESVNFQGAELKSAKLKNAFSIKGADFRGATILGKPIERDDIPEDKGEYYANWNPPPKKEES